ncbi:MAG TPA: hypothetical protein VNT32_13780 [Thermoleophilaceae bacterium]|nr:hypothetical protein [Thermoleophilaceae bacterium]
MPTSRPASDVAAVLELRARGFSDGETSRRTGVPVQTIRTWRQRGRTPESRPRRGDPPVDAGRLPSEQYAYLLGLYLGDGTVFRCGSTHLLRITLDEAYPGIIASCAAAIEAVRGRPPRVDADRRGARCRHVISYWNQWPRVFPQHGPGRKHLRPIELAEWQQRYVHVQPGAFLRGLIHSDGWRGENRVRSKGREYSYPRYQFSNRSDDIRGLFTATCDRIGVRWRPWGRWHISVARRESVAILDSFIGPKR